MGGAGYELGELGEYTDTYAMINTL